MATAALLATVLVPTGSAIVNPNCHVTQAQSTEGSTSSQIEFVNSSGASVDIYWLDYAGERVYYATLADGAGYLQSTWLTHPWVAVDAAGNCLGYVLSESLEQTYVIQPLELPGNSRLFYLRSTSLGDLNHDIYSVRPDGEGATGLFTGGDTEQLVAISPDGSRFVYASKAVAAADSAFELYLEAGDEQIRLTDNDDYDNEAAWSPDGRSIAFVSDRGEGGVNGIYVMDLATRAVSTVFQDPQPAGAPSFSPSGDELTFDYCVAGQPCRILAARLDGSGVRNLTNGPQSDVDPDWGPHGRIVFVREGDPHGLFTIDPAIGAESEEQLAVDGAFNRDPSWSPDGTQVAYVTTGFGNSDFDLARIAVADGTPVQVVSGGRNGFPDWQPLPAISSPVAGTTVVGTIAVRASAGDVVGVGEIQFFYTDDAGTHSIADDTEAPFEASLDTTAIVGDDAIITARAVADGGVEYENSIEVDLDVTAPETSIEGGPGEATTDTVATFTVTANEEEVTFACTLDGEPLDGCGGTEFFSELGPGEHTFTARATDESGNEDETPAVRTWVILEAPEPDTTGQTFIASLSSTGAGLNGGASTFPSLSDDGNLVGFESAALNVTPIGSLELVQAYARNRSAGTTMLLSSSIPNPDGVQPGNANSGWVQVAGNGNSAVFQSLASNLACVAESCVPSLTTWHVYRRGLDAGSTQLVDAAGASIANGSSQHPSISADGNTIAFDTAATNLLAEGEDSNGVLDVYVRELDGSGLERVSVSSSGAQANGPSAYPALSSDGRFVAFTSAASNLVENDTNEASDVFVHDRETDETTLVSVSSEGVQGNRDSSEAWPPSVSADGSRIAFLSNADDFVPGIPSESGPHVFVRDLAAGTTEIADLSGTGERGNAQASAPALSDDGTIVSFTSVATNLSPLTGEGGIHVYARDLSSGTTRVVDLNPADAPGNGSSHNGLLSALSADGRFATFYSAADDLLGPEGDLNATLDVFVRDLEPVAAATGITATLTTDAASTEAGAKQLPIDNFPLSILQPQAAAVAPAPIDNFPIDNFPIDNFPIDNFPIDNFPIDNFPIDNFPIDNFAFDAPTVARELDDVPLSTIGIAYDGGWPKVLEGSQYEGVPPQGVSLAQLVLASPPSPALTPASGAPQLLFEQLDFSSSKLRRLGFEALAVGAIPLAQINPLGGGDALTDWCVALSGPPVNCTAANRAQTVGSQTVLGAALTGAPIDNFPIDNFPIDNFPIDNFPIDNMPIDNFPIDNMPLSVSPIDNFPIDNFDLAASGFGELSLRRILGATLPSPSGGPATPSPLGSIPIAGLQNPAAVLTVTTDATLGAAFAAGHVKETAKLSHLAGSLGGFTLGDLLFYGDPPLTVGDLLDGLPTPTGLTFNDLLALYITRAGVAWETLSADLLGSFGANGGLGWRAAFTLEGPEGGAGEATVEVTLPSGWRYAPATSVLRHGETMAALPDPSVSPDGRTLSWTVADVAFDEEHRIDFDALPGIDLGPTSASLSVAASGTDLEAADTHSVVVRTVFEPNDDPATAPIVEPNVEVDLSYLDAAGDSDFYRIPTPPAGWRLNVHMTNLAADYDLTLYAPATVPPLTNTGTVGVPLQDPPIPDDGIGLTDLGQQLQPGALQDIPTVDLPIAGQSIFRGTDPEDVAAISIGGGGYYVLQVSGYNEASSPRPYTLRVTSAAPRSVGACAPRSFPHPGSAGSAATIPANANTLFLVNRQRLERTYGTGLANDVLASLASVAGQNALGVSGAVVPVEAYGDNAARYAAWDANPCAPELANAVASGIAATVNSIRLTRPGLKYLVFVGGDDQIPFFRVPDLTRIANESGVAATFDANQYSGAFIRENLLSDDPYLDTDPIQAGARQVFVPDLAGGRLVETPGQIIGQLTEFVSANGALARNSAFSAGYDFASDGTAAASAELSGVVGAGNTRTLIDDTWNRVGLLGALFPTGGASGINQLNGHYDHHSALPAAGNTTGDTSDLLTTADLDARPGSLPRRIVFTIGCHAGLPVSNVVVGETSPIKRDWAEAYADQRSAFAANTGFGLGSTDSVAWSEQLMAQLAGHLDGSLTIGEALAQAKADYFLGRASFSAYEQKTTLQATLYGLPFFGVGVTPAPVGTPPPPAPPAPPVTIPGATSATPPNAGPIAPDPISLLPSAEFSVVPAFTRVDGEFGDFWTNAGQVTGTHYRPLVSTLALPATRAGQRAHSALIESLVSQDDSPWDPSLLMPTTDSTALSPEPTFTDIGFPSAIPAMATAKSVTGTRSQLNLATSQFFTDDTPGSEGATVMRRWTAIGGRVFYNASTDYTPPTIVSSEATRFGSNVGFEVSACSAVRVFVLFDDLGDTAGATDTWVGVNLVQDGAGSCRWTGGAPVIGPNVQYIVQACDTNGNCAMSTNKAHYFQAQQQPPAPPDGVTIELTGPQASGLPDYFTDDVSVDVTPAEGSAVTIDGRTPASLPAFVTTDGLHVVTVDTADGKHAERRFVIDATVPSVVIESPAPNATFTLGASVAAAFTCLDSGSGIRSCAGSTADGAPLPTGSVGVKTLTVTATDIVGHTTTATRTYRVVWPFTGFFSPVDNPPVVNVVNAGSSVPIKFSLGGNRGLAIFSPGSPASVRVGCNSSNPEDTLEQIDSPGASGLSYDAGSQRYHYVWKTSKAWAGTCRQLVVSLVDGSSYVANFKFK